MVNGVNLTVTAVVGEWLCMRQELAEIPISSLRRNGVAAAVPGGGGGSRPAVVQELTSITAQG